MLLDDCDDVLEGDLGCEGVAVVDDGFPIGSIPTVHYKEKWAWSISCAVQSFISGVGFI